MGTKATSATPSMTVWETAGCSFVRFDIVHGTPIALDKIFHDNIVLLAFEDCRWTTASGGVSRKESPGSVVVRDAGHVFSITAEDIAVNGGTCREIHISPQRLAALYDTYDKPLPRIDFARSLLENSLLSDLLIRAHRLSEGDGCTLEASEALATLLDTVAWQTSGSPRKAAPQKCARTNTLVVDYLRAHYDQSISLQDLADVTEMNPFVLLRQFQRSFGITPHEYLQIHRVNQAKRFIGLGERLADVAQICGFADQSHLTKQFKRRTGLTPGHFVSRTRPAHSLYDA